MVFRSLLLRCSGNLTPLLVNSPITFSKGKIVLSQMQNIFTSSITCSDKQSKIPLRKPYTPVGKHDDGAKHKDSEKEPLAPFPNDINPETGERGGPRGLEPTRYGDWERKGRCVDF